MDAGVPILRPVAGIAMGLVRKGDRVAILLENSFDYIIAYYGALKAGAVTVPLSTDTTTEALVHYLDHSESRAIVTNKKFTPHLVPAIQKTPRLRLAVIDQEDLSAYKQLDHCENVRLQDVYQTMSTGQPDVPVINLDPASIVYTSGSTGKPKGVLLTHLNMVANTRSIVEYLKLTSDDRIMVVLPFYYIYAFLTIAES